MEGVERATTIVRDIKTFSHSSDTERESVDLNVLLEAAQRIASPQTKHSAVFEPDYGMIPPVECAPREIQQVFLNLLLNAVDARRDDETATVQILTRYNERSVMVTIEDDGVGIPPELIERIFDPFFTTKTAGEGTGLGLALSYEIIRRHHGEIAVESRPGHGTRFTLVFPILADPEDEEPAED